MCGAVCGLPRPHCWSVASFASEDVFILDFAFCLPLSEPAFQNSEKEDFTHSKAVWYLPNRTKYWHLQVCFCPQETPITDINKMVLTTDILRWTPDLSKLFPAWWLWFEVLHLFVLSPTVLITVGKFHNSLGIHKVLNIHIFEGIFAGF